MRKLLLSNLVSFISALSILAVFVTLFFSLANAGVLTQIVLQYPFLLILMSGIIVYGVIILSNFVFFNRSRLCTWSYFFSFMALYLAVMVGLFTYFIPRLKMSVGRTFFRPTPHCNNFYNPAIYICFIQGEKLYTTNHTGCSDTATNTTSFYIISTWISSKNQYRLKSRVKFHPDIGPSYWLPVKYCIQEYDDPDSPSTKEQLRVAFISWTITSATITDTGYLNRNDLEDYKTGWYKVSNCMWEIFSLLPFDYCITGYVIVTTTPIYHKT